MLRRVIFALLVALLIPVTALAVDPFVSIGLMPRSTSQSVFMVRGTAPRGTTVAISVNDHLQARIMPGPSMDVYRAQITLTPGFNRILVQIEGTDVREEALILHTTVPFSDMEGHAAEEDVAVLATLGLVNGMGDGTFGPDLTLTRAQFAKLMVEGLSLPQGDLLSLSRFADVAAIPAWAGGYVAAAVANGLIVGYEDGTFQPDSPVSRVEVAVIAGRGFATAGQELSGPPVEFSAAAEIPDWAKADVQMAVDAGLISSQWAEAFHPAQAANRGEAASVTLRLYERIQ